MLRKHIASYFFPHCFDGMAFVTERFSIFLFVGHLISMTPEQMQAYRWEKEIDERNRPLSDEELDAMFPFEGYKVTSRN